MELDRFWLVATHSSDPALNTVEVSDPAKYNIRCSDFLPAISYIYRTTNIRSPDYLPAILVIQLCCGQRCTMVHISKTSNLGLAASSLIVAHFGLFSV